MKITTCSMSVSRPQAGEAAVAASARSRSSSRSAPAPSATAPAPPARSRSRRVSGLAATSMRLPAEPARRDYQAGGPPDGQHGDVGARQVDRALVEGGLQPL